MEESNYFERVSTVDELPTEDMSVGIQFNDNNKTPYIAHYLCDTKKFKISGANTYDIQKVQYWFKPV
jgi:hypothetical protein